jgi:hypothetical protein
MVTLIFFLFSFSCQIHSTMTYNHKTCICRTQISTRHIHIVVFFFPFSIINNKKTLFFDPIFLLSTDMPTNIYTDWNRPYENEYIQNQELFIVEPTDSKINF